MALCTPEKRANCLKRAWGNESVLRVQCANCFGNKAKLPSRYVMKLIFFYRLKDAGVPIGLDILTVDEWLELKEVELEILKIGSKKVHSYH